MWLSSGVLDLLLTELVTETETAASREPSRRFFLLVLLAPEILLVVGVCEVDAEGLDISRVQMAEKEES